MDENNNVSSKKLDYSSSSFIHNYFDDIPQIRQKPKDKLKVQSVSDQSFNELLTIVLEKLFKSKKETQIISRNIELKNIENILDRINKSSFSSF